ncbi:MAG: hypothetical protein ACE5EH_10590, partial [Gammaproteobacteria bacterium]
MAGRSVSTNSISVEFVGEGVEPDSSAGFKSFNGDSLMLSVIKQVIACLVIALMVATACYFLPFVNGLLGDYL